MMRVELPLIFALFLLSCCNSDVDEEEARIIARTYIAHRYPAERLDKLETIVYRKNGNIIVTYKLPDDTVGGVPFVTIDRRSGKVINSSAGQ